MIVSITFQKVYDDPIFQGQSLGIAHGRQSEGGSFSVVLFGMMFHTWAWPTQRSKWPKTAPVSY